MDETTSPDNTKRTPPFNNLYLLSGLVNGFNNSWMYFLTLTFLIAGYVFFQSIALFPLMAILQSKGYSHEQILENANLLFDSKALGMDQNLVLLLELGMFVFAAIGFFMGLKYIHKKTITSVLTGYEKFRFGRFWFAFLVWGALLVAMVLLDYFLNPGEMTVSFNVQGILFSLLIMVIFMPIQTGLEELVFRGYLVQGLAQIFHNGIIPLFLTSLLFGLAHITNPEVKEFGIPVMLTYYCCFALFMGAITLLDEGLELAFGLHFANNMVSSILVSSPHAVIKPYSIFEAKAEDPQSEIVVWFVMAALTFGIFWMRYRWKNFKLIIK
ncbi:MAG: CPBP family intramembrane metalloprotease [bacterium]|nr:CPBP family intramembrane metalloprotease [bacterium]